MLFFYKFLHYIELQMAYFFVFEFLIQINVFKGCFSHNSYLFWVNDEFYNFQFFLYPITNILVREREKQNKGRKQVEKGDKLTEKGKMLKCNEWASVHLFQKTAPGKWLFFLIDHSLYCVISIYRHRIKWKYVQVQNRFSMPFGFDITNIITNRACE